MATKEEVTEYINAQFDSGEDESLNNYWTQSLGGGIPGNRLSMIQEWTSPEVAGILQKLVGDCYLITRIARSRSNS